MVWRTHSAYGLEVASHSGRLLALASRPIPAIDSLLRAMAREVIKCWAANIEDGAMTRSGIRLVAWRALSLVDRRARSG